MHSWESKINITFHVCQNGLYANVFLMLVFIYLKIDNLTLGNFFSRRWSQKYKIFIAGLKINK